MTAPARLPRGASQPASRNLQLAVDSVESKFVVAKSDRRVALQVLGIDPQTDITCQFDFLDTPTLALWARGVVLRARRRPGRDADVAVELRPLFPDDLPRRWQNTTGVSLEVDTGRRLDVWTATLEEPVRRGPLEANLRGERPLQELFSKQQRLLLRDCGLGNLDWASLRVLGPVDVLKMETGVQLEGLPLIAEQWSVPDGFSVLEVSTRVKACAADDQRRRLWEFLTDLGLYVAPEQQTKTERTLEYFATRARRRLQHR